MNCNELNKRVMTVMQYGIAPLVTKYLQEHPEYFHDSAVSGLISNYNITLSFQPATFKDVASAKPTIFIELGDPDKGHMLACYDHHPEDLVSTFTIDSRWVTQQEIPNV